MVTYTHTNGSTATLDKVGSTVTMQLTLTGPTGDTWMLALPEELRALYPFIWTSPDFANSVGLHFTDASIDAFSAGDYVVTWQAAPAVATSPSLSALSALIQPTGPTHTGYAPTGAKLPYNVLRPMVLDPEALALDGSAIDWDLQYGVYCCGASVEASFNLAKLVIMAVHGQRLGGTTLSASMGYSGAQVEGHYECQVTIQLNQGGI